MPAHTERAALIADTPHAFAPVADGHEATASINLVNTGDAPVRCRVAIAATDAPTAADYLEYDQPLVVGGAPLLRTGEILAAGERVVCVCDGPGVAARVARFEEVI